MSCSDPSHCDCNECQEKSFRSPELDRLCERLSALRFELHPYLMAQKQHKSMVGLSKSLSQLTGDRPLSESSLEAMNLNSRVRAIETEIRVVQRKICEICPNCVECELDYANATNS